MLLSSTFSSYSKFFNLHHLHLAPPIGVTPFIFSVVKYLKYKYLKYVFKIHCKYIACILYFGCKQNVFCILYFKYIILGNLYLKYKIQNTFCLQPKTGMPLHPQSANAELYF